MKNLRLSMLLLLMTGALTNVFAGPGSIKNETDSVKGTNYTLLGKSDNIDAVKFHKSKKTGAVLYIKVGSENEFDHTSSTPIGVQGQSKSEELKNATGPIFDKIEVLDGGYDKITVDKLSTTQNYYTFKNINFPLTLVLHAGKDMVKFKLTEAGIWDVDIKYKK